MAKFTLLSKVLRSSHLPRVADLHSSDFHPSTLIAFPRLLFTDNKATRFLTAFSIPLHRWAMLAVNCFSA